MTSQKDLRFAFVAGLLLAMLSIASAFAAGSSIRNPNDDPAFGDGVPGEYFGGQIAADGDTVAVGSVEGVDASRARTGAVRVFVRQAGQWVLQARLMVPDLREQDAFGAALALEGDTLAVGAPRRSRGEQYFLGAVYVFEREGTTWRLAQTLERPNRADGSMFGSALALSGNTLAVGAVMASVGEIDRAGSVNVFERTAQGWQARHELVPTQSQQWAWFGTEIAFAGQDLAVGAYGENGRAGAVYAFTRTLTGWSAPQRLVGAGVIQTDGFGVSIAASADRLLIGAPADLQPRPGYAIEWRKQLGRWVESVTLRPTDPVGTRRFGLHVAHRGGDAWHVTWGRTQSTPPDSSIDIGTYRPASGRLALAAQTQVANANGLSALATDGTQVFLGIGTRWVAPWTETGEVLVIGPDGSRATISPGGTATDEYFGEPVTPTPRWLAVGAPYERRHSALAGAVFVYDLDDVGSAPTAVVFDPVGVYGDLFGYSLAHSGDTLIVSAPFGGDGSVQAFDRVDARWQLSERWTPPAPSRNFGYALAADASTLVVGAPTEVLVPAGGIGAAFVYERVGATWSSPTRLAASDVFTGEAFAEAVAVDGDVIAIGGPTTSGDGFGNPTRIDGVVRVFESRATGWEEVAILTRPPAASDGEFGTTVAVEGDTLFVGAPRAREVHVYVRTPEGWQWAQRIDAPASAPGWFGVSVKAIDGALWVSSTDLYPALPGSLHRFERSDGAWRLMQSLPIQPWQLGDGIAVDFTVANDTVLAGRPLAHGYAPFVRDAGRVDLHQVGVFQGGFE